ncbi:hypothetical protein TVAG_252910 [Trichomonas vaginalis G3]|uniref:Uncharacterized protein n=1 Tax=Trichomonas vaginalis (strain ATCC PRA-98 / G3) TaxID=412133 RepID=A2EXF0_TRIV3|nr:hypothetical protein TVAGG3_0193400 [Trichomonas vaginalis G3]EAY02640.1 hypothetical protein TVAG_252910 [Trichomonas vaginalis G3]KAI5550137.1 hypothetical protein TVAGG3_0193400 [Trichomonas vaginalis G3]|eukprot:XP_001314863.1 hypothetical protein [Trichomonas vaginalis G3]
MSIVKIEGILEKSKFIDGKIVSDSLSNILTELCQLVSLQGNQINILMASKKDTDTVMSKFVPKEEYDEQIQKLKETISQMNSQQTEINNSFSNNLKEQVHELEIKMNQMQTNANDTTAKIEKDAEFQTTLFNKLISKQETTTKTLTEEVNSLKSDVEYFTQEIKSLKNSPVKDVLSQMSIIESRLDAIPEKFNVLENNFRTSNISLVTKVNDFISNMSKFEEQVRHELLDIRRMTVDFPTFTIDGKLDTPSLIQAVNRDTRRIDSFNEMISGLGNSFNNLVGKFEQLETHFQNMEYSICEFSNTVQNTTTSLQKRTDLNHEHVKKLGKEIKIVYDNLSTFSRQATDGLAHDATVLTKVLSHFEKISNRPVPVIQGYEEFYNDQNDLFNQIGKCADDFNKAIFRHMKADLEGIPSQFIYLPSNEVDEAYKSQSKEHIEENRKQAESSTNQRIETINKKITVICDNLSELQKSMDSQLRQKANAEYTDRMFEKLKHALDKQKDFISDSISSFSAATAPLPYAMSNRERPSTVTGQRFAAQRKSLNAIGSHELLYGKRSSVVSSPLVGRK